MFHYDIVIHVSRPMMSLQKMDSNLTSYLLAEGGPILRWLTATELASNDNSIDREALKSNLLACPKTRYWLDLLGSGPVHHSKDLSVENVLGKLGEYGLRAGQPKLDARVLPYCAVGEGGDYAEEALILVPFLIKLGYSREPQVASWMKRRLDMLYDLACRGDYDFYMSDTERQCLPPNQRYLHGNPKLFYQLRFNNHWNVLGLPTCYDLYALAYHPKEDDITRKKIESIVNYLLNPEFQQTPGGYIWDIQLRRPFAAGRVFLACLPHDNESEKLVLFLEMMAQFESGRTSEWFRKGMTHLETFRTERGSYCFPRQYLSEKHSYYLYAGMHMGLGELPRDERALELESTFRMLRLKKNILFPAMSTSS